MSEPLKELHAQRALIQKHLDWLDAQIASVQGSESQSPEAPAPRPATQPALSSTEPTVVISEHAKAAPVVIPIEPIQDFDELAPSSNGSDLRRAQIGCFAFFLILTLLFLFLLFGLPYLLD